MCHLLSWHAVVGVSASTLHRHPLHLTRCIACTAFVQHVYSSLSVAYLSPVHSIVDTDIMYIQALPPCVCIAKLYLPCPAIRVPHLMFPRSQHYCCAGFLYPSGDYTQAASITADLISDTDKRRAVGAAARAEVERWGWTAATQRLREQQYQRAIKRNRGRRW